MAFSVVLDTCVLYPAYLRDTLLRMGSVDLYRPLWSAEILEELRRNLVDDGLPADAVRRLLGEMSRHFGDAEVVGHGPLIHAMTCDAKDRHVLAAAVRAHAAAIITFNGTDFPEPSIEPYEIEVIHPDDFLLDLLDLDHISVWRALGEQVASHRREPTTLPGLLAALERGGVPKFADMVRRRFT